VKEKEIVAERLGLSHDVKLEGTGVSGYYEVNTRPQRKGAKDTEAPKIKE